MDSTTLAPLIDSHIHLWPGSERYTLRWNTVGGPLDSQYSLDEYLSAVAQASVNLKGFVFVEADRTIEQGEAEAQWTHVFEELNFYRRLTRQELRDEEGYTSEGLDLQMAAVLWAPVPAGREVLGSYLKLVKSRAGAESNSVKGFRYLLQDKPKGAALTSNFIEGLKLLGEEGYTFDLGIDMRGGGVWQLEEAVVLIQNLNERVSESKRTTIVINHMCKPDMYPTRSEDNVTDDEQGLRKPTRKASMWETYITELALFPNTYMKLSGGLSETHPMPSASSQAIQSPAERQRMLENTLTHVSYQIRFCLKHFGPARCMFGSNWPVENINGGGNEHAWYNWHSIMSTVCSELSAEDAKQVWSGTAIRAYKLDRFNV